jgi:hypothetical protein
MHRMRFSVHTCTEGMNYVPNENKTYKPRKKLSPNTVTVTRRGISCLR